MKADIYDKFNKKISEIDLPEFIFMEKWRPVLVKQAISAQLANSRNSIAHAKDRSEVRGGGRKPWRQKHTGRARHGSIRSPLWAGGGVTFGPRNERIFFQKINKKMKQKALFSVLAKKAGEGQIKILGKLQDLTNKTRQLTEILNAVAAKADSILIISTHGNKNLELASRNIKNVKTVTPKSLNVYDCLRYQIILIDETAIAEIIKQYRQNP
jgi:large subunit ribosomal protein L4